MLLDDPQRREFCRWLESQIISGEGILQQMQKINIPDVVMQREKQQIAACKIVLHMITSAESVTVE